jgi:aerobic carbon-monoxide dehydrogenase large subunit
MLASPVNDTPHTPTPLSSKLSRREDERLLTGQAKFVCNVAAPQALHAVFVRSPYARATIVSIDKTSLLSLPDVVAVLTADDLHGLPCPQLNEAINPIQKLETSLWGPHIRTVGAPVALILGKTRQAAQLAADSLMVDYDVHDAVLDFASGAPILAQASQNSGQTPTSPATASVRIESPRVAASPLEPRAALMQWDEAPQTLTAHLSTQTPSRAQAELAVALKLSLSQIRVIAIDVGGAFGGKASVFPEDILLAAAAHHLRTSIRWQASRGEDLTSATHGRGSRMAAQLWASADGNIQALNAELQFALGAWLPYSAVVPLYNAVRILPGPYRVPNVAVQGTASASNTAAVGIYRGAGRPEAALLMERAIDAAAQTLWLDPLAMRLVNVWPAQALPRQLSPNAYQDTADFPALLTRCAKLFDYDAKRKAQQPLHGIGIALYTEPCGAGGESVRLTSHADGTYLLATGSSAQGQARETAYAGIAAQALGCDADFITVTHGDTASNPLGVGALASRSTAIGGSAILSAVEKLRTELSAGANLPHTVDVFYTAPNEAWASGCMMVALSIDGATGQPTIDELVWVDDAGRVMSDALVHGQLIGGMAQGIGQALMERIVYDEYGQLLTGSLMDYALPRASDMPRKVIIDSLPTLSAANLLGAKGVGEAGCIGVPAAILNAAYDALRHVPQLQLDFPLSAQTLWRAMTRQ